MFGKATGSILSYNIFLKVPHRAAGSVVPLFPVRDGNVNGLVRRYTQKREPSSGLQKCNLRTMPQTNGISEQSVHTPGMKYTARHIQRFLETGRIDATLWKNHFPTLLPTQVPTCDDCGEFKDRTCAGGRDPVECFLAKPPADEHRKKKRDPMLGLGVKGPKVHGTAKPKDQSKM